MHHLPFGAGIGDLLWDQMAKEDASAHLTERGYIPVICYFPGFSKMGCEEGHWNYVWNKDSFPANDLFEVDGRVVYIHPATQQLLRGHAVELFRLHTGEVFPDQVVLIAYEAASKLDPGR